MMASSLAPPWTQPPQKTYIFLNASVICPLTSRTIRNQTVKISDGFISSIIHYEQEYTLISHPHETTIDLSGKYICPGLIDSHIHISAVPGPQTLGELFGIADDVGLLRQPHVIYSMLKRGFTSVRDCGGASLALKEAVNEGVFPGPRLFIAGRALSQTGGHGDTRGSHTTSECFAGLELARRCDGVAECLKAAREEIRQGADFIKIMSGGGVASPTDKLESIQFTAKEVRAISTVAKQAGTYVTAHAYTPASIRHAIDNGVTGIEHGNLIDEETARYMAEKDIYLTPTLVTYAAISAPDFSSYIPPGSISKNDGILSAGLKALQIADDAGVTMLFGTDLLGPMTTLQTREFGLRAKVLSSEKILKSATINPAKRLGMENFLGQIKKGFAADFLILNENPLEDVTVFDRPESHLLAVIKDGRVEVSRWSHLPVDARRNMSLIE